MKVTLTQSSLSIELSSDNADGVYGEGLIEGWIFDKPDSFDAKLLKVRFQRSTLEMVVLVDFVGTRFVERYGRKSLSIDNLKKENCDDAYVIVSLYKI